MGGRPHAHRHHHMQESVHSPMHVIDDQPPLHAHRRRISDSTVRLLTLGSSPMVEDIRRSLPLRATASVGAAIAIMFSVSTIATYGRSASAHWQGSRAWSSVLHAMARCFIVFVGIVFGLWPEA